MRCRTRMTTKPSNKPWTEARVFESMNRVFPAPAFVLLPQVRAGTGYTRNRTLDAIAVSVWPSRGLYLAGIEIKVSRRDWRRELSNPAKAAALQKYCRHFWVASPKDVVAAGEVPATWGHIQCTGKTVQIVKPAPKLEPSAPDLLLLCSILRKMAECTVPRHQVEQTVAAEAEARAKCRGAAVEHKYTDLLADVETFQKAAGIQIGSRWDAGDIGKAVRFVRERGILDAERIVRQLRRQVQDILRVLDGRE
jgi:hypothetical protein